jgi:glyoxylase-like metal-dependent hydrolase (beta-lactamase superfamily II)
MELHDSQISPQGLCLCCVASTTFSADGGWINPRQAYARARNIVDQIRAEAVKAPITVHPLRRDISVLKGSGGNIAVLIGSDGKLLVDAGITASKPRILEALASLSKSPISHLINTHWHFDHADGNEWIHHEGAQIYAHENTRKHLLTMQRVEDWDFNFPALAPDAIPSVTLTSELTLSTNCSTLALKPYAGAHTDSDISVRFSEADVLHVADTFWNGVYPFIDYSTGGSIDGMIVAAEENLAVTTNSTIVIPGHGYPVSNRSELQSYRDMLVTVRDRISKLKRRSLSLDEVVQARPTESFDPAWGGFVISPTLFTRLVYEGV